MEMLKVHHCNQVVTPLNQQLLDLAGLLSICTDHLHPKGQYMYLDFLHAPSVQLVINSQLDIAENDVVISSEVFTEILIDVASGTLIKDAMLKQNILVKY